MKRTKIKKLIAYRRIRLDRDATKLALICGW